MSRLVKRTEHTYYCNDAPITDLYEAIYLLSREQTSNEPLYLVKDLRTFGGQLAVPNGGYELIVPWYNHRGYGSEGIDYYQIDQGLAQQLVDEKFVVPRQVKHWGYTETKTDEFVLSHAARGKLETFEKEMEKKAESMLTPGIHTDLTGKPKRVAWRRDGFRCGKLYFDYELPRGGTVRVYPQQDRLVMPDKEKSV